MKILNRKLSDTGFSYTNNLDTLDSSTVDSPNVYEDEEFKVNINTLLPYKIRCTVCFLKRGTTALGLSRSSNRPALVYRCLIGFTFLF